MTRAMTTAVHGAILSFRRTHDVVPVIARMRSCGERGCGKRPTHGATIRNFFLVRCEAHKRHMPPLPKVPTVILAAIRRAAEATK